MNEIMNITEVVTMTSLEIVNLINKFREEEGNTTKKEHKDFMKSIRNEIETLKGVGIKAEGNFSLGSYIDKNNQERPCYKMNKSGIMQMLNKESALVRYKTQQYIEVLENKLKQDPYQHLSTEMKALIMHDKKIQAVQKEVIEVKDNLNEFKDDIPLFAVECEEVAKAVTTDDAIDILKERGFLEKTMELLMEKIYFYINKRSGEMPAEAIVFSNKYGILGKTAGADEILKELK